MKQINIIRLLVVALLMCFVTAVDAQQELKITEPFHQSMYDVVTASMAKKDLNGNPCAVVKIQLPVQGVKIEGNVISTSYDVNEYLCYFTAGTKKFRIKCPGFETIEVDATKVEPKGLKANVVYAISLAVYDPDSDDAPALSSNTGNAVIDSLVKNMVFVKGGKFMMGATKEQEPYAKKEESPAHAVSLADYRIGRYEVTQREWVAVMGKNPSKNKGDNLPVDNVRLTDCHEFIKKLNELTGLTFRLPTEAEWEYAARGGKKSQNHVYAGSDQCNDVAWTVSNSSKKPHAIGTLAPNELGIYDMSGNVSERCEDEYNPYDMTTKQAKAKRVGSVLAIVALGANGLNAALSGNNVRGGSWQDKPEACRVSSRAAESMTKKNNKTGFRLAL